MRWKLGSNLLFRSGRRSTQFDHAPSGPSHLQRQDRWKDYDPENPPYKFFPNRSRATTNRATWLMFVGGCAGSLWYAYRSMKELEDRDKPMLELLTADQSSPFEQDPIYQQARQHYARMQYLDQRLSKATRKSRGLPNHDFASSMMDDD